MALRRLDTELVRRKLAKSRTHAQELIRAKRVKVSGDVIAKPASQINTADPVVLIPDELGAEFVSRGAFKLLGALDALSERGLQVEGKRCLDAGASTGGFTDVLLRKGARSVLAVDVGYGQLAWQLRSDPRVEVLERTNIRYLTPDQVGEAPTVVVGDLSFISLELIIPPLVECAPDADFLLMVKPQFEVGKARLGEGGVVSDPSVRAEMVVKIARFVQGLGLQVWAIEPSPLPGPAGNVEYFVWFGRDRDRDHIVDIDAEAALAVARGPKGKNDGQ